MKHLLIAIFSAFLMTACVTNVTQPTLTPQEIAARVCPPTEAVLSVLAISPAVSQDDRANIEKYAPSVHKACAMGAQMTITDLNDIATIVLPGLAQIVNESSLEEKDKQNVLLAIALAQIAISAAR